MNTLPTTHQLDIGALSRIFDNTSASYKYLLFKSILESVHSGNQCLIFKDLALRSISEAWYSVHFYKLSYGRADRMMNWVSSLDLDLSDRVLISDLSYHRIYNALKELDLSEFKRLNQYISEFSKHVPYRLITPWFTQNLKAVNDAKKNKLIQELCSKTEFGAPYEIIDDPREGLILKVSDDWCDYFKKNYSVINGWWSFCFLEYLQKRNPTVLSLATKLAPPNERNMSMVKSLFADFFKTREDLKLCLYSSAPLDQTVSHDHFFPWSFLGSDPLYNFAPTTREINSRKSNQIPDKSLLSKISSFQYEFFSYLRHEEKSNALEYYFNDLQVDQSVTDQQFHTAIHRFYEPLYLTAQNQGFEMGWTML
jgi:hypothetical protein